MADILSPEEIESLLTTLADDAAGDQGATPDDANQSERTRAARASAMQSASDSRSKDAENYDFRRPDKLSKEQLRKLHMLHETCGRAAGTALAGYLRTPVHIELVSVEQIPYEEYLQSINQSVFAILSLPPLSGQAVLEIEFSLIFSLIDRMLGGPGKTLARTSLSEIERPLVEQLFERFAAALKTSWEAVAVVNPEIDSIETSSQFVQIATPNDTAVTVLFEIKAGNQRGAMSLCIPYLVLKPITQKLSTQKWMVAAGRKRNPDGRRNIGSQLLQTRMTGKVALGSARVSISEFLSLRPGDVVRLEQARHEDLELQIADKPKFLGQPAIRGNKLIFRITGEVEAA